MQRQSMIGSCLLAQDVIYETRCNVDKDPTSVDGSEKHDKTLNNTTQQYLRIEFESRNA